MLARLLVPALVLALAGCIPTGKKCCNAPRESAEPAASTSAEEDGCCSGEEQAPCCSAGKAASAVELKTVEYDELQEAIRSHKGKVVVVDVWASWCTPCKEEFPHLVELHKKYGEQGLVCLSVSVDDEASAAKATEFLKKVNATFGNYRLDEETSFWQEKWDLKGIPAVFVFDREGKRAAKLTNDDPDDQFSYDKNVEPLVKKLLGKQS
jgi:thiol-disulfide isomerase/thioredoxin